MAKFILHNISHCVPVFVHESGRDETIAGLTEYWRGNVIGEEEDEDEHEDEGEE